MTTLGSHSVRQDWVLLPSDSHRGSFRGWLWHSILSASYIISCSIFSIVATKYHGLGGLHNRNSTFPSSGRWKSRVKVLVCVQVFCALLCVFPVSSRTILMASFKVNYHLKTFLQITVIF